MLLELNIKNFVIIDNLKIEFSKGLNVITGETGAGKSIVIGALELLLGSRASADTIRKDKEKAVIQALFDISEYKDLMRKLRELSVEDEDGIILISREIYDNNKNKCYVNDKLVSISTLKTIGNYLVDLHGQHEHQSLLRKEKQLYFLDGFGQIYNEVDQIEQLYNTYQDLESEITALEQDEEKAKQYNELYSFQLKEIEDINPKINEDKELANEYSIANNIQLLVNNANKISYTIVDSDNSLYSQLVELKREIIDSANIDMKIKPMLELIESNIININEIAGFFCNYKDMVEFDPDRFDEINKRIDRINFLKSKYGNTIEEILNYKNQIYARIEKFTTNKALIQSLIVQRENIYNQLTGLAGKISEKRKKVACNFEKLIINELKFLGMENAQFKVGFKPKPVSKDGIDDINFLISANMGEDLKLLQKVASGGEISRVMLAMKKVLAQVADIPVLIFDEIDTGISGKTAHAVGEKISQIAKSRQILCITHLPQIASKADSNYLVEKIIKNKNTFTLITKLTEEEKVIELARMMGTDSKQAITLAKEMIKS